jgi:hypothetical protein
MVVQDLVGIKDLARAGSMGPEDLGSVADLEWAEFRAMGEELEFAEVNERGGVGTTPEYIYCAWRCAMARDFCFGNEATGEFHSLWRWLRFMLLQLLAGIAAFCLFFSDGPTGMPSSGPVPRSRPTADGDLEAAGEALGERL